MVDYHYDDNIHIQLARKRRVRVIVVSVIAIISIAIIWFIYDVVSSKTKVSTIEADTSKLLGQATEKKTFDQSTYTFIASSTWQQQDPPSQLDAYNVDRFVNTVDNLVRQELLVFVDTIPPANDFELVYVMPIEIEGNGIRPFEPSSRCGDIAPDKTLKIAQTVKWAGVSFWCDSDGVAYRIGTSHNEFGYGAKIDTPAGSHRYFFVMNDFYPTPRFSTLAEILRTFQSK